jgi:uncharacterized protein YeeX (DUF496 family)
LKDKFSNNWDSVRKAFLGLDTDYDGFITVEDILRNFGGQSQGAAKNNNETNSNIEPYKHSDKTKAKIKQRLSTIMSSEERKNKKSQEAKEQHLKARLEKYRGLLLNDNLNEYIKPIIKKGTGVIYKYEVRINNITTQFYDGKSPKEELYNNATNFLKKLKEQNNIV